MLFSFVKFGLPATQREERLRESEGRNYCRCIWRLGDLGGGGGKMADSKESVDLFLSTA